LPSGKGEEVIIAAVIQICPKEERYSGNEKRGGRKKPFYYATGKHASRRHSYVHHPKEKGRKEQ